MATTFVSTIRTTTTTTCSAAPQRKPDSKLNNNNKWWAPLFPGISADPDYITNNNNNGAKNNSLRIESGQENRGCSGRAGPEKDIFRGCFTEEKAKELRKKTAESSTFHDIMYHSSIASRLATDVSGEFDR